MSTRREIAVQIRKVKKKRQKTTAMAKLGYPASLKKQWKGKKAQASKATVTHRKGLVHKPQLVRPSMGNVLVKIREDLGLGRKKFAQLTGFSERTISGWEKGSAVTEPGLRKIREMKRLQAGLAEIMDAGFIPEWLKTPNEEFGGATPSEIIERGEID